MIREPLIQQILQAAQEAQMMQELGRPLAARPFAEQLAAAIDNLYAVKLIQIKEILARPPVFRAYTEGDDRVCGFCRMPVYRYEGTDRVLVPPGEHAVECRWAAALELLDRLLEAK